jgi:hypothetical protein
VSEPGCGHVRVIASPEAEVMRLARERQVRGGQICAEADRRDGCPERHAPPRERGHDPAHCDHAWEDT